MHVMTTDAVAARDRFAYWREMITRQFMHLRPERVGSGPFYGHLRTCFAGDVPLTLIDASGQRVLRTRTEIARSTEPCYFVTVQVAGVTPQVAGADLLRQREDKVALSPGDVVVLDALHEFELDAQGPCQQLVMRLPAPWVDARVARPDLVPGAVLRQDNAIGKLLAGYLLCGYDAAEGMTADDSAIFIRHALDLLAHALSGAQAGAPLRVHALREALFVRACRLIELRSGDPELAPHQIADAIGLSTRLLHRIFAEHGETVMKSCLRATGQASGKPACRSARGTPVHYRDRVLLRVQ